MLSDRNSMQKTTYYVIPFIGNVLKQANLETERFAVAKGLVGGYWCSKQAREEKNEE